MSATEEITRPTDKALAELLRYFGLNAMVRTLSDSHLDKANDALAAAEALTASPSLSFEERIEAVREALTEYDRRDRAWDMREAAKLALRAAGVSQ